MLQGKSNASLAVGLVIAVALWGGNNAGTKWLVGSWPPIFTGGTRFFCAGLLLLAVLRVTTWFGTYVTPSRELSRALWLRGGVSREAATVLQTLPPVDNAFVPPEHARTWLHAGGGVRLGRTITDIGFARWQQQYRLLIDVKLSTSRDARTVYGSRR